MDPQSMPKLFTVSEVADLMRVSRMTIYRLIHSGELPALRAGKSFRIPQTAVQELLDVTWSDDKETGVGG